MRWSSCGAAGDEPPPSPRSGHSATLVGDHLVVVFGGLHGTTFRADTVVFDAAREAWFRPRGAAVGGPGPRAFHCAVAIGKDLYVMCGRTGRTQHGDVWVLDTETWSWADLARIKRPPPASSSSSSSAAASSSSPPGADSRDSPAPRDFGTAAVVPGTSEILLFGGYDGRRWLNDAWTLDAAAGRWRALAVPLAPPPRSGHAMTAAETRHVVFGGQAAGGALCGDLWALRDVAGFAAETTNNTAARGGLDRPAENAGAADTAVAADAADAAVEPSRVAPPRSPTSASPSAPRWTRLRLGGASPCARTGHTLTAGASSSAALIVFGGHGDDGWLLSRRSYYDDVHCVDGAAGRWRRVSVGRDPSDGAAPAPRAFHTLTNVGRDRALLFGGFTGETALGDAWWLNLKPSESEERFDDDVGTLGGAPGGGGLFASPVGAAAGRFFAGLGVPGVGGEPRVSGGGGGGALGVFGGFGGLGAGPAAGAPASSREASSPLLRTETPPPGRLARAAGGSGSGGAFSPGPLEEATRGGSGGPDAALERLVASLEGAAFDANEFAAEAMGEDGAREFLASCDAEDLRVGDARKALEEYRRVVPSQAGLGPVGPPGGGAEASGGSERTTGGRFMHVAPEALRVGDVPAMLAELQGALIAEAHEERSRHAGETTDE